MMIEKGKFNVITNPWIDTVTINNEYIISSIRDIFLNAHKYKEIYDNSPLYEYGIYRLLTVFLMDIYEPIDEFDLIDMLNEGKFDIDKFDKYVQECYQISNGDELHENLINPFNIFDEHAPFLQSKFTEDTECYIKPVTSIIMEMPCGNTAPIYYYGGSTELNKYTITYAESVKVLCSIGPFSTSMSQGYPSSVNGTPPYYFIIKGKNLFETLLYNSVSKNSTLLAYNTQGVPWKTPKEITPREKIEVVSLLQGMTILTRKVKLIPNEEGTIGKVMIAPGENFIGYDNWRDPHTALRKGKKGYISVKPRENRDVYKDLGIAVNTREENKLSPITMQQLKELCGNKKTNDIGVVVYGVLTSQASYLQLIREDTVIPQSIISDPDKNKCFTECIKWAGVVEKYIYSTIKEIDKTEFIYNIKNELLTELTYKIQKTDIENEIEETEIYNYWKEYLTEEALRSYDNNTQYIYSAKKDIELYIKERNDLHNKLQKLNKGTIIID